MAGCTIKNSNAPEGTADTIGVFYQTPEGKVAYVFGAGSGMVRYHFNDGVRDRSVNLAGTKGWVRLYIGEFPDATDHCLPYSFDLHWDVKTVSGLVHLILHKEHWGTDFDLEDAKNVLEWLDDEPFWSRCNLSSKDFKRIRRCLKLSFGLVKEST